MRLSKGLMLPEMYADCRREQLFRERRTHEAQCDDGGTEELRLQLVIVEYKGVEEGPGDRRVGIRRMHMPDVSLFVDAKTWTASSNATSRGSTPPATCSFRRGGD